MVSSILPGAKAVVGSSIWGSSPSLDYVLDDVKCFGSESKLLDCHSSPVLSHNCLHTEEAGVTCHGEGLSSRFSGSLVNRILHLHMVVGTVFSEMVM